MKKSRLNQRRGAVLVLVAILMVSLLMLGAFAMDFSRLYVQKNELQTSADAAALAAAMEINQDPTAVADSAISFAARNKVQKQTITLANADVICGVWDDVAKTFTAAGSCSTATNAVDVTVRTNAQSVLPTVLNFGSKQVNANSRAWLAYVDGTGCLKPFGLNYTSLTYVLRADLSNPIDPDPLRTLTQVDFDRLKTRTRDQLRFKLKQGSPPNASGNFGALDLTGGGGSTYRTNIGSCVSRVLSVGDTIDVQTGNLKGPTVQGVQDLCNSVGSLVGDECRNSKGTMGINVKAPLWYSATPISGTTPVEIKMIGSFELDSVTNQAEIVGVYNGVVSGGTIGSSPTPIRRPILVK